MANYAQSAGVARVPRVLFFTAGMVPTAAEYKAVEKYRPNVAIRNGTQVAAMPMDPLEECDAVAGKVPDRYAKTYPDVSDFNPKSEGVMLRMSDLDRFTGKVTDVDNEARRGAKPPAVNETSTIAQGAPRPAGGISAEGGGFIAPRPSSPDNLPLAGGERAVNAPQGGPARGPNANPHSLPDGGVTAAPAEERPAAAAGSETVSGFTAPSPVTEKPGKASK